MRKTWQWFALIAVTIDATRTGRPITKLMFGGFVERATTQVWAETASDLLRPWPRTPCLSRRAESHYRPSALTVYQFEVR